MPQALDRPNHILKTKAIKYYSLYQYLNNLCESNILPITHQKVKSSSPLSFQSQTTQSTITQFLIQSMLSSLRNDRCFFITLLILSTSSAIPPAILSSTSANSHLHISPQAYTMITAITINDSLSLRFNVLAYCSL